MRALRGILTFCLLVAFLCSGALLEGAAAAQVHERLTSADLAYIGNGRRIELEPSLTEVAIRLREDVEPTEAERVLLHHAELLGPEILNTGDALGVRVIALNEGAAGDQAALLDVLDVLASDDRFDLVAPVFPRGAGRLIATDEIAVQLRDGGTLADAERLAGAHGLEVHRAFAWSDRTFILRATPGHRAPAPALAAARALVSDPIVEFAQPNFVRVGDFLAAPNDTYYAEQWALNNTGQTGGTPDADIDAQEAWDIGTGNTGITIAIIDSGVDMEHEDLSAKIVSPYDAVEQDDDPTPNSWDGHGTSCAGVASASTNNSAGVAGVAWHCNIMPVRILYSSGGGGQAVRTDVWVADGIATAVIRGADVLSNSWHLLGGTSDLVDFAIDLAKNQGRQGRGCVIVFAAGNDYSSVAYPAVDPAVIAVGATNEWDEHKSPTSQDGEDWWGSNYGPEISVTAPGVHCWTTDISGAGGYNDGTNPDDGDPAGDYFSHFNGTSCATPHVAGLAALILSQAPDMTSDEVQAVIENTADDLGDPGFDWYYGHGRINANAALTYVEELLPIRYVSGTLTGDRTWHADTCYVVTSTVTVPTGSTLHVSAGTVVKFDGGEAMNVNGTLDLQGTEGNEVVFTSLRDDSEGGDTNGDGAASIPEAGNWHQVKVTSANTIEYCRFKYAGAGGVYPPPMLHIDHVAPAPTISHCTFIEPRGHAIYYEAESTFHTSPVISDNTFIDTPTDYGIAITGNGTDTSAHIMDNAFIGCSINCEAIDAISTVSGNTLTEGRMVFTDCSPVVTSNTIQGYDGYPILLRDTAFPYYGGNTIQNTGSHAVDVAGTIRGDGTWRTVETGGDPLVYEVTSSVTVDPGATLTIPAGTVVKFTGGDYLTVNGILDAQGTPGNEVVFTSYRDDDEGGDTNHDGSTTTAHAGDWRYVNINNGANAIENCRFKYGGYSSGCLWIYRTEPAVPVSQCSFQETENPAIRYEHHLTTATASEISSCTFNDCPAGIEIVGGALGTASTISGNTFDGSALWCDDCSPLVTGNAFLNSGDYPVRQTDASFPTFVGNTFAGNAYDAIGVSGSMTRSGSWPEVQGELGPLVYQVRATLTIEVGATLTIPSGTVVKFASAQQLTVRGGIDPQGAEGGEVVFTSWRDDLEGGDTNRDGTSTLPGIGDWKCLEVESGGHTFRHCRFKYGGGSYSDRTLWIDGAASSVDVLDCEFADCNKRAIYYEASTAAATAPTISGNVIAGSTDGIEVTGHMSYTTATVSGNEIVGGPIRCRNLSPTSSIDGNTITGGGLIFHDCSPSVTGNTVQDYTGYPLEQNGGCFPAYSGNTFVNYGHRAIKIPGATIGSSGTWVHVPCDEFPLVYELTGSITIPAGVTLTIPAGTVVKFDGDRCITVNGVLEAQGTNGNEVVFTSWYDDAEWGDSNCDTGAHQPAEADWGYIRITAGGNSVDHCRIKYAGGVFNQGYALHIDEPESAVPVTNCTFVSCNGWSIRYDANQVVSTSPVVSHNELIDADEGIWVNGTRTGTVATISDNVIYHGVSGEDDGIFLENLAAGTWATWNVLENFDRAVYCFNSDAWVSCSNLSQTGGYLGTGTGIRVVEGSVVTVNSNSISGFLIGIDGESGSGNPPSDLTISANRITDNADYGVRLRSTSTGSYTGPSATIFENDILGNGDYDLYLGQYQDPANTVIDARSNWWGTADTTAISALIYDYVDDPLSPHADFIPVRDCPISFADPDIAISPGAIEFEVFPGDGAVDAFTISNAGALATLSFSIEEAAGGGLGRGAAGPQDADTPARADIEWLSAAPMAGTVSPQGEQEITVTCSSSGLDPGNYTAFLVVTSDDPDESPSVVPVSMSVSPVFLTSPDGGEHLVGGDSHTITWTTDPADTVETIDLYLSIDAGESFEPIDIGVSNELSYAWEVPETLSDLCLVKIVAHYPEEVLVEDTSDGCFTIEPSTSIEEESVPDGTLSFVARPNPCPGEATFRLLLPQPGDVSLSIYDVAGRLVSTRSFVARNAGEQAIEWNGRDADGRKCPSGVYFCRVVASGSRAEGKLVVLR